MRSHLLNDTTAEQYRLTATAAVERVAAQLASTKQPFTGASPRNSPPSWTPSTWTSRWAARTRPWTNSAPSICATPSTSTTPATWPT